MRRQHQVQRQAQRELRGTAHFEFTPGAYASHELIRRLTLTKELEGHGGCVNCLKWSPSGALLASGSDDLRVMIWGGAEGRPIQTLRTAHTNNIFSVEWVPGSGEAELLSGAGDGGVRLLDLHRPDGPVAAFNCHRNRVKRLAVSPSDPALFWTAAEDGLVMEFDTREAADCEGECAHALVDLRQFIGPDAEAKCIAVSPTRAELLAVGANDPYARIFDRRMLSRRRVSLRPPSDTPRGFLLRLGGNPEASSSEEDFAPGAVRSFCPAHIPNHSSEFRRKFRPLAATFLTFHPARQELLVNLGGEQIYIFDTVRPRRSLLQEIPAQLKAAAAGPVNGAKNGSNGHSARANGTTRVPVPLGPSAEALKEEANSAFADGAFSLAIELYSAALAFAPTSAVLFANRAAALMKRKWDGDVYAALRDAHAALALDARNVKALFRTARCLAELGEPTAATDALALFRAQFPREAASAAFTTLAQDLKSQDPRREEEIPELSAEATSSTSAHPSALETSIRNSAGDYSARFVGHCNTTTDIKEANFVGANGEFVAAGSDDGTLFVWERDGGRILNVLKADASIVNCVQPHPTAFLLATAGIDSSVKLWSAAGEAGRSGGGRAELLAAASANQRRMNADPFEAMLLNLYGNRNNPNPDAAEEPNQQASPVPHPVLTTFNNTSGPVQAKLVRQTQ